MCIHGMTVPEQKSKVQNLPPHESRCLRGLCVCALPCAFISICLCVCEVVAVAVVILIVRVRGVVGTGGGSVQGF